MTNTRIHARMPDLLSRPTLEFKAGGAPKRVQYFPYHTHFAFSCSGKNRREHRSLSEDSSEETCGGREYLPRDRSRARQVGSDHSHAQQMIHTHSLACSLLCGGVNKIVMLLSNSMSWYSSILEYKCESKHWDKA